MRDWYQIRAAGSGTQEILLYGDIGESWSDESVTARQLVTELAEIQASTLIVRVNSYGGSVTDGLAIFNALRRHSAKVEVEIDGAAVSIASLIAMAGETVRMAESALLMIHAPWGSATGNANEMREMASVLDGYAEAMLPPYAARLGEDSARRLITDGTDHWFTADEALAAGLVDEITHPLAVAAQLDLSRFNPPGGGYPMTTEAPARAKGKKQGANLELVARTEADVLAKLTARNEQIKASFKAFAAEPSMAQLMTDCLADSSLSIQDVNTKILAKLAEGDGPVAAATCAPGIGGHPVAAGDNSHHGEFVQAATDAVLIRAGVTVEKPHPGAQDLRGMSALRMAETMLNQKGWANGYSRGGGANSIVKAAMSTSDFPLLLANVANKALQQGYENEPASHRAWTREVEVPDFKPNSRVALSEAPGLEEVKAGAEYTNGALSERAEAYSLATYGRMLILTRKAIINDDLGGFTRIPMAFGASAARKEADLVYAILTGNPAMSDGVDLFHADHGNLLTAAALSVTSLGVARAAMRKQTGLADAGLLNVVPRYLIVPAALETTAEQLVASLVDPSKSNDTTNPEWVRRLEIAVDPRLDVASETGWYLAANAQQVDTVEVAHLEGQRGVFTEEDTEFTTDNYRIKARLDFATQAIDWVGMQMNPGA